MSECLLEIADRKVKTGLVLFYGVVSTILKIIRI